MAKQGDLADDAAIRFGQRLAPIEVQAKYGLKGGEISERRDIRQIAARTGTAQTKVVLAVDSGISKGVRHDLAIDLERMRSGRFADGLRPEATQLRSSCTQAFLNLPHVVTLDVAHDTTKLLLLYLEENARGQGPCASRARRPSSGRTQALCRSAARTPAKRLYSFWRPRTSSRCARRRRRNTEDSTSAGT